MLPKMLLKEFRLSMHPTCIIFLMMSAMLIIPNYPYYTAFFYTGLAIFFTCLSSRENHDIYYTLSLPVTKKDLVKGRIVFAVILETVQLIIAIPFAALRQMMPIEGNLVGMDANIAFFGLALVQLGIFNLVFFSIYYKNVNKVGTAFLWSSTAVFVYIAIVEVLDHIIPFFVNYLDTPDTKYVGYKLIVLFAGIIIYAVLTLITYFNSARSLEKADL